MYQSYCLHNSEYEYLTRAWILQVRSLSLSDFYEAVMRIALKTSTHPISELSSVDKTWNLNMIRLVFESLLGYIRLTYVFSSAKCENLNGVTFLMFSRREYQFFTHTQALEIKSRFSYSHENINRTHTHTHITAWESKLCQSREHQEMNFSVVVKTFQNISETRWRISPRFRVIDWWFLRNAVVMVVLLRSPLH